MSSERDPYFAFPALRGAPAYARPPKYADDVERPFDPDDLPLAAEQSDEESALLRDLGVVGRYQPRLAMATVESSGPGVGSAVESSPRRLSLRAFTERIRPRSS
ncbi:MAG: hypothetical protein H6Q36_1330 [Chloroflexi bacterium]|nr:hypothetical protein [Chloroflexota bacterium]